MHGEATDRVHGRLWWSAPAVAICGAYGLVGIGLTVELIRTGDDSLGEGWELVVPMIAAMYWVGVGVLVLPLAWFAHRGARWARIGLAVVGAVGAAWAGYWLSYEQYGWEGLAVAGATVFLCAIASIVAIGSLVRERSGRPAPPAAGGSA